MAIVCTNKIAHSTDISMNAKKLSSIKSVGMKKG